MTVRTLGPIDRFALLIALLTGALSAFAFAPFGLWPLMPLAFALLLELVARSPTLWRALALGWCFGVGQFVVGLNWIATAFTYQAAMPAWLGWIAVVLLSLYLAVYPALATGLAWRLGRKRPVAVVLALAGGWAVTEWLRAVVFTGFAWNPVGSALVDTPWRAVSSFVGTYGLSLLVVLAGGAIWLGCRRAWKPALAIAFALGFVLTLPTPRVQECCLRVFDGGQLLHAAAPSPSPRPDTAAPNFPQHPAPPALPPALRPPPSDPPPPPLTPRSALPSGTVRIVQPNIGQAEKWRPGFEEVAKRRLSSLSARPYPKDQSPAETVFWPEAAVTEPLSDERPPVAAITAVDRQRVASNIFPGQLIATGGLGLLSEDGATVSGATNSLFVLDSAGTIVGRYDKAHLVPYGEYLPMRPILSAIGLSRLAPGDVDFTAGPGPRTLKLPSGRKMGVQICYEIIFSGEVVDPESRPDYIFNPSNDAWFGAWGPPQHLAQARLRAAEEGLPIIRSTPTGVSALIDAGGRLVGSVGMGRADIIDSGLPMAAPPTLFSRFGNVIPLALGLLLMLGAIALGRSRRYRRET